MGDQAWKTEPDGVAAGRSKEVLKQGDEKRNGDTGLRVQDEGTSSDSGVRTTEGRDKIIRGGFEGSLLHVHPGRCFLRGPLFFLLKCEPLTLICLFS